MKHTREQLSVMSDFEVNKTLCLLLGFDVSGVTEQRNQMIDAVPNFCEDWSRLMPLAVEYDVGVYPLMHTNGETWMASFDKCKRFEHQSPQRAIACCLIMVLESQQC